MTSPIPSRSRQPSWWMLAAPTLAVGPAVVALTILAMTGLAVPPSSLGLPDPGPVTQWGLPMARASRDIAAVITIGVLATVVVILPGNAAKPRMLSQVQFRLLSAAGLFGWLWAWAAVCEIVLTYSDVSGAAIGTFGLRELDFFVRELEFGTALAWSLVLAAVVAFGAITIRSFTGAGALLLVALAALWPLSLTGHASGQGDHDLGANLQFVHLTAGAVWVGGLVGLLLARKQAESQFPEMVARYSRLAWWCFIAVAASGLLAASLRVPTVAGLDSSYGRLVLLKVGALTILGIAGWYLRRRIPRFRDRATTPRLLTRVAIGEIAVMACAVGIGVALSRTPPPPRPERRLSTAEDLLGFPMPPALGPAEWFTQWRIDSFWGLLAVVAGIGYLAGVRRLAQRSDGWSWGRTAAWLAGCIGLFWSTSGAPAVYGDVLFSMHMVQHMTLATAVPTFLVLGAPATLALRAFKRRGDGSRGPREWLLVAVHSVPMRLLSHPLVAAGLFVVGLVGFYYTPLFEFSLRTHTGHLFMTAHFLVSGYLYANVICGVDPGPKRPIYPLRLLLIMVPFGFHAFFSVSLMASETILAADWFGNLGRTWGGTLESDQYLGASIGWALGDYPLAILAIAVVWAWVRDDHREARRFDRQAERDNDQALADYNAYLAALRGNRD